MNEDTIELFRALSDATRQELLKLLSNEDKCVHELCEEFKNMSQPTVSHHLQILKHCKLVSSERKGKMVYYSINKKVLRNGFEEFIAEFEVKMI